MKNASRDAPATAGRGYGAGTSSGAGGDGRTGGMPEIGLFVSSPAWAFD